ncbi:glycosyltransferase [Companilactobacillus jidongensis]|uniref:glycosyltransferase n=1 Tax=Companilactobacillus jidongensis TaxID=2486006 RepID=UPI000F797482|nr:glycosyltransferase [Companilactobacillus jidongensis]
MKTIDVIVPYFYPPYIGGTETVLRKWNEYFSSHQLTDIKVRFILPFAYRNSDVFDTRGNCYYGWRVSDNKSMRVIGVLNLLVYLIFTRADNVIVLSPKYINLSHKIRRIFHKQYQITNWIHFSLAKMFVGDRKYFKRADYHLAISTGIKEQLLKMQIPDSRIFSVFNPIERDDRQIPASSDPKYIYVGRLEYQHQKNLQELIRGFEMIKQELPHAKLELWGDGPDVEGVKRLVKGLQLDNSVSFKGWQKDPWSKINSATAFVLTSTYEGLPMSILEAMSHGVPVVAADVSTGPADEITDDNGLLYESGHLNELKNDCIEINENRKHYDATTIQKSINKFYTQNYFSDLIEILEEMG